VISVPGSTASDRCICDLDVPERFVKNLLMSIFHELSVSISFSDSEMLKYRDASRLPAHV
jgi:hypothetical protein